MVTDNLVTACRVMWDPFVWFNKVVFTTLVVGHMSSLVLLALCDEICENTTFIKFSM